MKAEFDTAGEELRAALGKLLEACDAALALLVTREGTILAETGTTGRMNTSSVAALVAAMYSATSEVARLVGEKQFSVMLQQGETHHLHMSLVGEDNLLVIVFEDHRRIGRVRHEARKAAAVVVEILDRSAARREQDEDVSPAEFKQRALHMVDRLFES